MRCYSSQIHERAGGTLGVAYHRKNSTVTFIYGRGGQNLWLNRRRRCHPRCPRPSLLHPAPGRWAIGTPPPPLRQQSGRKEGNLLFNDALNTFHLRLYGVRHMVEDHSESERGNPLPPHGLLFRISSKGSFICIIPPTG